MCIDPSWKCFFSFIFILAFGCICVALNPVYAFNLDKLRQTIKSINNAVAVFFIPSPKPNNNCR